MEASAETSTGQRPSNYGALATLDVESAIDEIASGTLSKEIAERFGVTPRAVRNKLAKHPDYPQAVKDQAQSLVEQATGLAMTCGNADVPIARLRVETAHKWAAVADPERFSPKAQAVNVNIGVQVSLTAVALGSIEDLLGAVSTVSLAVSDAPQNEEQVDNQEHSK